MTSTQLATARQQYLAARVAGQSWQQAVGTAGLPVKRAAAYALEARFRLHGATVLPAGRHGHPYKLGGAALTTLETLCRAHPDWPSARLQQELIAQAGCAVSPSLVCRVRRRLGLRYHPPKKSLPVHDGWVDGAGGLLLLAAGPATALLPTLTRGRPHGAARQPRMGAVRCGPARHGIAPRFRNPALARGAIHAIWGGSEGAPPRAGALRYVKDKGKDIR